MEIIYYVVIALLSSFLVILVIALSIICTRKPVESEESLPAKPCARAYPLSDINTATDGFNHAMVVGQGRLGKVYIAMLETGEQVAVKRIHPGLVLSNAGFGFSTVMKSISLASHHNIVSILGYSQAPGERIIVTDFYSLGSLDFYLHQNPDGGSLLDWSRRVRIAAGAARGLEYLHEGVAPSIVHGCVKAANILIDHNFNARLCDYGLSFLAPQEKRGLVGYLDEDYWKNGARVACKESDVYGFGVVLIELLSGRRNDEQGLLVNWAISMIKDLRFSEFLDPRLVIPSDLKPLLRLAKVALACVGNSSKNRPSVVQIATILNNLEMDACP